MLETETIEKIRPSLPVSDARFICLDALLEQTIAHRRPEYAGQRQCILPRSVTATRIYDAIRGFCVAWVRIWCRLPVSEPTRGPSPPIGNARCVPLGVFFGRFAPIEFKRQLTNFFVQGLHLLASRLAGLPFVLFEFIIGLVQGRFSGFMAPNTDLGFGQFQIVGCQTLSQFQLVVVIMLHVMSYPMSPRNCPNPFPPRIEAMISLAAISGSLLRSIQFANCMPVERAKHVANCTQKTGVLRLTIDCDDSHANLHCAISHGARTCERMWIDSLNHGARHCPSPARLAVSCGRSRGTGTAFALWASRTVTTAAAMQRMSRQILPCEVCHDDS